MDNSEDTITKKEWLIQERKEKIENYYHIDKKNLIGSGAFGSVLKIKQKGSQIFRAVKIIPKSKLKNKSRFLNEINIMKNLDHPNIIKLYETFEDIRNIYIVMEYCQGGELFEQLTQKGHYSEQQAKLLFKQIAQAVYYCHKNYICHRDLKPENLLLLSSDDDSPIKIIDFGYSVRFAEIKEGKLVKHPLIGKVGTAYYTSPDIYNGQYDELCDMWSLGVILYILLSGVPPFYGNDDSQVINKILNLEFRMDIPEFKQVSESVKELISQLLCTSDKRLNSEQVLQHSWVQSESSQIPIALNIEVLKRFTKYQKLKKIILYYIATQLPENEIQQLGILFKQLDTNNDGVLSFEEIKNGLELKEDNNQIKELKKILSDIDIDANGSINYTEFIAACLDESQHLLHEKIYLAFKAFDIDGSGKISKDELKKILGSKQHTKKQENDSYWDELIQNVDSNGDGEIDYNEFINMMKPTFIY